MRKFRNRLTLVFVLLLSLSVVASGIFVSHLLHKTNMDSLSERLAKEAKVLTTTLDWESDRTEMDSLAETFGEALDARVTFVASDGTVLGDSQSDPAVMENHLQRPEVREALEGGPQVGEAVRYSRTMDERLMYVASPVIQEGHTVGVVRIALELDHINESIRHVGLSLVFGLLILLVVAALISSRLAHGITRPIENMTRAARRIARGEFHSGGIRIKTRDELGQLSRAINHMAGSLERQLQTIHESERRLKSLVETMPSGLLLVEREGNVRFVNPALKEMLGLSDMDLVDRSYMQLSYSFELGHLIEMCLQEGRSIRQNVHLFTPAERILDASLSPIVDDDDEVASVVVILHEITAMKRLEQLRSEFVANVSHELKTPVTAITGFAETLLDGAMTDRETCRRFLEIIHKESQRLQRLIWDILDLSKIESRELPLNLETLDVSALVRYTAQSLQNQVEAQDQTMHLDLPDEQYVKVDEDRIRQIVVNLLTNAIVYTPSGGQITVKATGTKEDWTLEVSDTGIGIPEDDLPRIFERFYRIDRARSRDSGGTGLGLAIVKHIVELHGGQIHVESRVGKGTSFILTFPR